MDERDFNDVVLCPQCGAVLERLDDGIWFCQKCVRGWTRDELTQNPDDLSSSFTINSGADVPDVRKWKFTLAALSVVSEVAKLLLNLKPRRRLAALTRFEVSGDLRSTPKPS